MSKIRWKMVGMVRDDRKWKMGSWGSESVGFGLLGGENE